MIILTAQVVAPGCAQTYYSHPRTTSADQRPLPTQLLIDMPAEAATRLLTLSLLEQLSLHTAGPVASVDILGIAVDAARLRLGLRAPTQAAASELAALGIALVPVRGGASAGETWRVGLAGGG